MNYDYIDLKGMIDSYKTRLGQLEAEHFSNTVYQFEASVTPDSREAMEEALKLQLRNGVIEKRIEALRDKVHELSELENNSEDQDDSV